MTIRLAFLAAAVLALTLGPAPAEAGDAAQGQDHNQGHNQGRGQAPLSMQGGPAYLNTSVEVTGEFVLLGDVFSGSVPEPDTRVAYSPRPGRQVTLDANWLASVAKGYGVDWWPTSVYDRALVSRASRLVTADQVIDTVRQGLIARGLDADAEIDINGTGDLSVHVPVNSPIDIRLGDISFDRRSGQFQAVVNAPDGLGGVHAIPISGRAFETVAIPVPSHNLARDDVIRAEDLTIQRVRAQSVRRDTVMNLDDLIGKSPRRYLRAGSQVRANDVNVPVLIENNSLVTLVYRSGAMNLTVKGKAMEDGAKGSTIRVRNTTSRTILEGHVINGDTVLVQAGTQVAANP